MGEKLYSLIVNWWYIVKSHYPLTYKLKVIWKSLIGLILLPWYSFTKRNYFNIDWLRLYWHNYQLVLWQYYEDWVRMEYYFHTDKKIPVIIDGWASIWDSMLYFKNIYPQSEIHSFEPDTIAFGYLEKNMHYNQLKNVHLYKKAISTSNDDIVFYYDDEPSYSHSTIAGRMNKNKTVIPAMDIMDIIWNKEIDLLKLDIEWSEMSVMKRVHEQQWFANIHNIILEYHHNIPWEQAQLGGFLEILEQNWYKYQIQAGCYPLYAKDKYQDIHIFAYRH